MRIPTPRTRRGVPLWVFMLALVLVPQIGVTVLTTAVVRHQQNEVDSAHRAERAVQALAQLDAACAAPIDVGVEPPTMPIRAYCSSLARESAMSRLRMVSWPIRSTGPKAESSVRSMDSLSGW